MADRILELRLVTDVASINKGVQEVNGRLSSFGSALKGMAAGFVAAFAVSEVVDFGQKAVAMASDLNESISKVNVVFGENAAAIMSWSQTASEAMGATQGQALKAAGNFGALFTAMGVSAENTTAWSTSLAQLAADLASFNNTSVDEALVALQSGMVGEMEPMRRFGAVLSAVNVEMKAQEMGLGELIKQGTGYKFYLTDAEKIQARYALIMDQTAVAQGDFARTSEGLANSQKTLNSKMAEFQTAIGQALYPAINQLVRLILDELIPVMAKLWEQWQPTIAAVSEAVGSFGARMVEVWNKLQPAIQAFVEFTSPIIENFGVMVGTVFDTVTGTLDAVIALLNGDFTGAWNAITGVVQGMYDGVVAVIGNFLEFLGAVVGSVGTLAGNIGQSIYDGIASGFNSLWSAVKGVVNSIIGALNSINEFSWERQGFEVNTVFGNAFVGVGAGAIQMWPDIPTLGKGGIVSRPTLAMIGEAGPEAVVPLGRGGGMGSTYNIHVSVAPGGDLVEAGRQMVRAITSFERREGRAWRRI